MIKAFADTRHMTMRHVMELLRQPWWIFVNLVQPVIWLLLFGALFESVTDIPGFGSTDYIQFLAPGVVVMTAFFTAGWSGMPMIEDLERGVVDRFLVSPVRRSSLITGRLANAALQIVVQTTIIIGLALATGAQFSNGIVGVLVLTAVAILLGASFGALSNGLALLARREETLIALMQFLMLPLSFLSVTFMQKDLMPGWMHRLGLQPSQLDGRGGARGAYLLARLGADRRPGGNAGGLLDGLPVLRRSGLPGLPAVDLNHLVPRPWPSEPYSATGARPATRVPPEQPRRLRAAASALRGWGASDSAGHTDGAPASP
jgi:ABC-2 type transport system permease protein